MLGFLKRLFAKRKVCAWSVDESAGGYRVGDLLIRRSDMVRIVAFKRDLITVDQICIGLAHGDPDADGSCATEYIDEDNPSYAGILADLEVHFSLRTGWWASVAHPAFETNFTILWSNDEVGSRVAGTQSAAPR